ncbi:phytanoyl-CoA dioxygenase family protein [Sphingomonas sp. QA11]|uniref:phytanoyl-CoA dioxygenase family protein n=1 Tax=Sphingomonas sp. QA11 TaxID=2950605 RepID=UPI00234B1481|nr:phytanoyl-CoA dioxygenase family protein [Sphingomonas sp. QA11]WCM26240.1 phytanoyl-CoA dioxygenase family protein [Sphingomonas sp. QA11]
MSAQLGSEELDVGEALERDGFCGPLDAGASREKCTELARSICEGIENREMHPLYGRFSVRDWHLINSDFLELLTGPKVLDAVSLVLGDRYKMWRSKIFHKSPGEGPLGWHQEWGAFNGEEIGNDRPALIPAPARRDSAWNVTVWMPLTDVTPDMGPMRFARGSHKRRFPIRMGPLAETEFYVDPFTEVTSKDALIRRVKTDSLCIDIHTAHYFDDVSLDALSFEELRELVEAKLREEQGAITLDFHESEHEIVSMPMSAGQFVIFTERCMHGSSANTSAFPRIGINARFTFDDTQVYPFRHSKVPIDGSNLDISLHRTVLIPGWEDASDGASITLADLKAG